MFLPDGSLIGRFDVYVVIAPDGDRPYVSTTPPSAERLKIAEEKGWRVYVATFDQRVLSGMDCWAKRVL